MTNLKMTVRMLTTVSLLALLALASAYGQTGMTLHANVPFDFEAGGKTLPAGTYQFRPTSGNFLEISNATTSVAKVMIITTLSGFSFFRDAGLVFNSYEGKHVLAEIWIPGQDGLLVSTTSKKHSHEMVIAVVSGPAPNMSGQAIFERTCAKCHGPNGQGNPRPISSSRLRFLSLTPPMYSQNQTRS